MGSVTAAPPPSSQGTSQALPGVAATSIREFLAFKLGSEEYGVDILKMQEIRFFEQPTHMANAPVWG